MRLPLLHVTSAHAISVSMPKMKFPAWLSIERFRLPALRFAAVPVPVIPARLQRIEPADAMCIRSI
jgi:hypothetical protein